MATAPVPRFATDGCRRSTPVSTGVVRSSAPACRGSAGSPASPGGELGARRRSTPRCADAGIAWPEVQVGVRRQRRGGPRRHPGRRTRPDRHAVHQRQERLRDRRQRARVGGATRSAPARPTSCSRSGSTSTRAARSTRGPRTGDCPAAYGEDGLMVTTQFFGMKIPRYMHDHGISERTLALVAEKAYRNGALNPNAWRREPISAEEIAAAGMVNDPLTRYMFCSPGEGAAALVARQRAVAARLGRARCTCSPRPSAPGAFGSFEVFSPSIPGPARRPASAATRAAAAFEQAGVGPGDVDVVPAAGHRERRRGHAPGRVRVLRGRRAGGVIAAGATEIGGRLPVNTDGGCIANGEPIGASGLRQVYEIVTQLRGQAGDRQVPAPAGRLHPRLRRPGRQRVHRAGGLTDDDDDPIPTSTSFGAEARAWLASVAEPRVRRPSGARRRLRRRLRELDRGAGARARPTGSAPGSRPKFDAGWGALTWPRGVRRPRPAGVLRAGLPARGGGVRRAAPHRDVPGDPAAGRARDRALGHRRSSGER